MDTFSVLTLNVGGRNDNPYEFVVQKDRTERGDEVHDRIERTEAVLKRVGPSRFLPQIELGLARVFTTDGSKEPIPQWIDELVHTAPTWHELQQTCLAGKKEGRDLWLNLLDVFTQDEKLNGGRPSPNIGWTRYENEHPAPDVDTYLEIWLKWLDGTGWRTDADLLKRVKRKGNMSVQEAMAGIMLYDIMIYTALHESGQTLKDAMDFKKSLIFTRDDETGRRGEIVKHLESHGFPEAVAVQEAKGLESIAKLNEVYHVCASESETVVLLKKENFSTPVSHNLADAVWERTPQEFRNTPKASKSKEGLAWETTTKKNVLVTTTSRGRKYAIGGMHCKESPETFAILKATRECMMELVPDADLYVIGVDTNSKDVALGPRLEESGFLVSDVTCRTQVPASECMTVAKERTSLQPQLHKAHLVDMSRKDYILGWAGEGKPKAEMTRAHVHPVIVKQVCPKTQRVIGEKYIPNAIWPFDHASMLATFRLGPKATADKRSWGTTITIAALVVAIGVSIAVFAPPRR